MRMLTPEIGVVDRIRRLLCRVLGHVEFYGDWHPGEVGGFPGRHRVVRCGRCGAMTEDLEREVRSHMRMKRGSWGFGS
jgi:hypothetical protein